MIVGDRVSGQIIIIVLALAALLAHPTSHAAHADQLRLQLNWFHDPTFVAAYQLQSLAPNRISIKEGGPSKFPLAELRIGQADVAIVGFDVLAKAIDEEVGKSGQTIFRLLAVEMQRNPVGYVLHPDVADELGTSSRELILTNQQERNRWLAMMLKRNLIRIGDKPGTETSAVWLAWKQKILPDTPVNVVSVGFDPLAVLQKPHYAYPVYLNEEPFKLSARIGQQVLLFDPSADGVSLYGNVLVTTSHVLESRPSDLKGFINMYRDAWASIRANPASAANLVAARYTGVPLETITAQIVKTAEFVFAGDSEIGKIDADEGGRLESSIRALKKARIIRSELDENFVRKIVVNWGKN